MHSAPCFNRYIDSNAFTEEVQAELRSTFDFLLGDKAGGFSDQSDGQVYGMLSHVLQVDVSQHTSRPLLDNVSSLAGCSPSFLESLAVLLIEKTLPPSTFLFRENDQVKALYFIARGFVEALAVNVDTLASDPKIDKVYGANSVLGEVPFFFGIRQLFSARTRVNQIVRIYELPARDYTRFLEAYPDEERMIFQNTLNIDIASVVPSAKSLSKDSGGADEFEGQSSNRTDSAATDVDGVHDDGENSSPSSSVASQQLDRVTQAIENGRSLKDGERVRGLCSAAAKGRLEELERLARQRSGLQLKDSVNCTDVRGRTPLHLASTHNHESIVSWLVSGG